MPTVTLADGPYDLRYTLQHDDVAAHVASEHDLRGFAKLAALAPLVALAALLDHLKDTEAGLALGLANEWLRYGVTLGAAVALFGVVTMVTRVRRRRAIRRAVVPEGAFHLQAGLGGLRLAHAGRTASHGWTDILDVRLHETHLVIRTGTHETIIVPLRAFEDHEHMRRFAVFADEAARAARARTHAGAGLVERASKR